MTKNRVHFIDGPAAGEERIWDGRPPCSHPICIPYKGAYALVPYSILELKDEYGQSHFIARHQITKDTRTVLQILLDTYKQHVYNFTAEEDSQ